jgi:uncharacterized protein YchJ
VAILAAYRADWADFEAVAESFPIRTQDPSIGAHATGKHLDAEREALSRLSVIKHYQRGLTDLAPVVTSIIGDTATLTDCLFNHSVEVDYQTNAAVAPSDVGHSRQQFILVKVEGAWYVSDSTTVASGKTGDACKPPTA